MCPLAENNDPIACPNSMYFHPNWIKNVSQKRISGSSCSPAFDRWSLNGADLVFQMFSIDTCQEVLHRLSAITFSLDFFRSDRNRKPIITILFWHRCLVSGVHTSLSRARYLSGNIVEACIGGICPGGTAWPVAKAGAYLQFTNINQAGEPVPEARLTRCSRTLRSTCVSPNSVSKAYLHPFNESNWCHPRYPFASYNQRRN